MSAILSKFGSVIDAEWRDIVASDYRPITEIPSSFVSTRGSLFRSDLKYDLAYLKRFSNHSLERNELDSIWEGARRVYSANWMAYEPVSDLKVVLKHQISHMEPSIERERLEQILVRAEPYHTAKSTEVRSALRPLLKDHFDTKLTSQNGTWIASLRSTGMPLNLRFDFGGFRRGFNYAILLPLLSEDTGQPLSISYESALGFTSWEWDLIRSDILGEQLNLLFQNIAKILEWLSQIEFDSKASNAL